jgi:hypothetical protein
MKYTIREFAQEIRKVYPNDYDDLSDYELVTLWLEKFPNDIKKVNLNSREPYKESSIPVKISIKFPYKWIFFAFICTLLFLTNPDNKVHYRESQKVLINSIDKYISNNVEDEVMSGLSSLLVTSLIEENIDKIIFRKDYYLFSVTVLSYQDTEYNIGIGILNNVIISDKLGTHIEELLKELKNK